MSDVEKKKPDMVMRFSDIKVTVWNNEVKVKDAVENRKSFILEKIYKDKDDNWNSTKSFTLNDIDKISYLLGEFKSKVFPVNVDKKDE